MTLYNDTYGPSWPGNPPPHRWFSSDCYAGINMAERHQREDFGLWPPVQAGSPLPDAHIHMSATPVPADLFKWKAVNHSYGVPDYSNITTEAMNNSIHNHNLGRHESTSSTSSYRSSRGAASGVNSPVPPQNGSASLVIPQPLKPMHNTPGYKTYQCKMCDQMFSTKSDMLHHTQQVHNKQDMKPFSPSAFRCSQCQKCFANSSYLSQHNRIHAGIKPYKCEICERKFTQLSHLQQHIRTHTGEKPYKCHHTGCGKAFSQLSNLQSHSRSHMTDKPYRCNSCYKCYADESGLREHIPKHSETKHIKTQVCKVCGKAYTQETYLARHMLKHTGEHLKYQHSQKPPVKQEPNEHSNLDSAMDFTRILNRVDRVQENATPSIKSPPGSSAFMPLSQFGTTSANSSAYPYSFSSGLTTALSTSSLNPTLSQISSMSSPRFFPYDPLGFQKTDPVDRLVNDRLVNDRLVNDRLVNDRLVNDQLVNDRLVNDRLVNDRIVNDRLLNERLAERNMNMSMSSRPENMLANSFLSLQHIKNYASQQMPPSYSPCSSGNSRLT